MRMDEGVAIKGVIGESEGRYEGTVSQQCL